eukprot:TRINITY_DN8313_c0_g1_i5.p1 TRINITY_DN8313_c0_g1~~TRINITY_DN8313_c0_g1_i5.p1  ORF type:complete len:627 (+),score=113.41 TRINITY_DN8313_c0_g1_i5:166-2046(+)
MLFTPVRGGGHEVSALQADREMLESRVAALTAEVKAAASEMQEAKMKGQGLFRNEERTISPPRGRLGQPHFSELQQVSVAERTSSSENRIPKAALDSFFAENKEYHTNSTRAFFTTSPLQALLHHCEAHSYTYHDHDFDTDAADPVLAASCRGDVSYHRPKGLGMTALFGRTGDAPHVADIDWGPTDLGHWLVSVLAVVIQEFSAQGREAQKDPGTARDMGGVRYMVQPSTQNGPGIYSVRLFIDSKWRYVLVDDKMPCDATGRPLLPTMKDPNGGFFLLLILKAFAKLSGGYSSLMVTSVLNKLPSKGLGHPYGELSQALCDMSGGVPLVPALPHPRSEKFLPPWSQGATQKERAEALERFCDLYWDYMDDLLVDISAEVVTVPFQNGNGLKKGGVYRVLETVCAEVPAVEGRKVLRLLRLHAPYTCTAWQGPWAPDSHEWREAPRLKEVLCPRTELDGSFWIEFVDFLNHFEYVSAVKMFTGWNELSLTGELYPEMDPYKPKYRVQLTQGCKVFVAIQQRDPRAASHLATPAGDANVLPDFIFEVNLEHGSTKPALVPREADINFAPHLSHGPLPKWGMTTLQAGEYTITPICTNMDLFDDASYTLRVFAQSAFVLVEKQGLPM